MKLYELRAIWRETYYCPENGEVDICECYDIIGFAVDSTDKLELIANNLGSGFADNHWSLKRSKELRALYPNYDDSRETKYTISEVTNLIV